MLIDNIHHRDLNQAHIKVQFLEKGKKCGVEKKIYIKQPYERNAIIESC